MKKSFFLLLGLSLFLQIPVFSQTLRSGYFLEGNYQRFRLNPAFEGERGFFGFPLLSNLTLNTNGNVGLSNFIFPYNQNGYGLTTYMSGTVDADKFLRAIPRMTKLNEDLEFTLFSGGFRGFGGYNTISLSLRENMAFRMPKDFFILSKQGFQNSRYSFSGLAFKELAYADLSLGHSRAIAPNLRVGATAKILLGLAASHVTLNKLDMVMDEQHWLVESKATGRIAQAGTMSLSFDERGVPTGVEQYRFSLSSWGFGADFGAMYDMKDILEGMKLSAAITDLGILFWRDVMNAGSREGRFEYTGFGEIDPANVNLDDQLEQIRNDALGLMNFYFEDSSHASTRLAPIIRLGAEYQMPFYEQLSAAFLFSQRIGRMYDMTEARVYANIAPIAWFDASVNFGVCTYGTEFGWMLNFHPRHFTLFLGSDSQVFRVTPQMIPVRRMNVNLSLGMAFPLNS